MNVSVAFTDNQPAPVYELPDLAAYSVEGIRGAVPSRQTGSARLGPTSGEPLLDEAFRRERGRDLVARQGASETRAIFVEHGPISLGRIVQQLNDEQAAVIDGRTVTLRLPIVVRPGATLIVDGAETSALRLSTDRGAFLVNGGTLFIVDAEVTSWTESASEPTAFAEETQFRPFLASYVRSKTYVAGSKLSHLGFHAPTAYGFSLSSHPERNRGAVRDDWPSGVIVGSEFRDLFYGFYSYEARDVAIVDNRYVENIRYGIDPHDRSTRLVIARNTATGTRERHGIIGSRNVSHSLIFDNESYDNAGSGIMLDRQCSQNVICNNRVYHNGQGIAIYESPRNVLAMNLIAFNGKSAIRVRNSVDVLAVDNTLVGNGDYAIEISAKELDDHDKRMARGDKYDPRVDFAIFRTSVAANRGLVKAAGLGSLTLSGLEQDEDPKAIAQQLGVPDAKLSDPKDLAIGGELEPFSSQLLRALDDDSPTVAVRSSP